MSRRYQIVGGGSSLPSLTDAGSGTTVTSTSVIRLPVGTAAAPALSATSDTNTGWWWSPSGNLFFTSGGGSKAELTANSIAINSVSHFAWSSGAVDAAGNDTNFSRISPGVVGVG